MARRTVALLPRWTSRVFSVELEGAPLYFGVEEKPPGGEVPRLSGHFENEGRCFSLFVCSSDRIRRARFYAQLRDNLLRELPPGCHLSPMASFLPNVQGSLIRGYFLTDPSQSSSTTEELLRGLQRKEVLVCSFERGDHGLLWTQPLRSEGEGQEKFYLAPAEAPELHPSTLNLVNSDVFYSFQEAYEVLQKVGQIVQLEPVSRCLKSPES